MEPSLRRGGTVGPWDGLRRLSGVPKTGRSVGGMAEVSSGPFSSSCSSRASWVTTAGERHGPFHGLATVRPTTRSAGRRLSTS